MIRKTEHGLIAESTTTIVEFEGVRVISIRDAITEEEFVNPEIGEIGPGLELILQNGKILPLGKHPLASVVGYNVLSDRIAEITLSDWECDISIRLSIDEQTGDILVEPSAWTMRGGVSGLGFNISNIRNDLFVVGPFQQGTRLPLLHPQINGKFATWADNWEAPFLVFESINSGFTVQAWDERFIYKSVRIGGENSKNTVSFITNAHGPLERNRCVGNLCWRISVFHGDWQVPILRYRDWYWKTYGLQEAVKLRPEWLDQIELAVSWCPTNMELLEVLSKKVDPHKVFLHVPHWRDHKYDQDYPSYSVSKTGKDFILKAREMGFHAAPHLNSCQMNPDHPFFYQARDFCTRSPGDLRWGGWSWLPVEGWGSFGPPQSYSLMPANKEWNILVNVHLAWSPWRRQLTRLVADLINEIELDSVFVDVSQLIHNSDNSLLENLTYAEGSLKLIRELVDLSPGFCVAGEGRNEISTQYLSIVQFHLYNFAHVHAIDGEDVDWIVESTTPVNELLYNGLSRGIGYNYGKGENRKKMVEATLKQGAIPTLIFQSKEPVAELENDECKLLLDIARS